jgi:hypothetical protein
MVPVQRSPTTGVLQIEFQRQKYLYTPSNKLGERERERVGRELDGGKEGEIDGCEGGGREREIGEGREGEREIGVRGEG